MSAHALDNPKLSFKAKGVLAYLLSKPPEWRGNARDIQNHGKNGRDSILAALRELKANGYATVRPVQTKSGRLAGREMTVYDIPRIVSTDGRVSHPSEKPAYSIEEKKVSKIQARCPRLDMGVSHLNGHIQSSPREYSPNVVSFAQWSQKKGFHIISKDPTTQKVIYAKGGHSGGWTRQTLLRWEGFNHVLVERYSTKTVGAVLYWFIKNHSDQYVPIAHTFPVFAEKFESIQKAMFRATRKNGAEPKKVVGGYHTRRDPDGTITRETLYDIVGEDED